MEKLPRFSLVLDSFCSIFLYLSKQNEIYRDSVRKLCESLTFLVQHYAVCSSQRSFTWQIVQSRHKLKVIVNQNSMIQGIILALEIATPKNLSSNNPYSLTGRNMGKNIIHNKTAIAKIVLVVALVAVAVGGGAAGAYYLSQQAPSTSPSPSPTQNTQATSTPTQTTASPVQTSVPTVSPTSFPYVTPTPRPVTGTFRTGAYANYLFTMYIGGVPGTTTNVELTVDGEESYSGTPCWLYSMSSEMSASLTMKTTRWLSKSTLECLHIRVQTTQNGNVIADEEYPGDSDEGSEMPNPIDTTVGTETITVTAGILENCVKAETGGSTGTTTVGARSWTHSDVPIWGLVKMETYTGENLVSSYELTAYGG